VRRAREFLAARDSVPGRIRMSDIAFFHARDSLPEDLYAFLAVARSSDRVRRSEKLGIFWEMYDVGPGDQELSIRVQVERVGRSWVRRAGERIGLITPQSGMRLGWRDARRGAGAIAARAVVVDVGNLEPGEYRIEVTIGPDGERAVGAARRLHIVR
jgi:hypothetical protein